MRLRTQLILILVLLAVLPLSAIVLYSYFTSREVLERAVQEEIELMADEMGQRLESVRADLGDRFKQLGRPEIAQQFALSQAGVEVPDRLAGRLRGELGELTGIFTAIKYVPSAGWSAPRPGLASDQGDASAGGDGEAVAAELLGDGRVVYLDENGEMLAVELPAGIEPFLPLAGEITDAGIEAGLRIAQLVGGALGEEIEAGLRAAEGEEVGEIEIETGAAELGARIETGEGATRRPTARPRDGARPAPVDARRIRETLMRAEKLKRQIEAWGERQLMKDEELTTPVWHEGRKIGVMSGRINPNKLLHMVLERGSRQRDEVPFAVDPRGEIYVLRSEDRQLLSCIVVTVDGDEGEPRIEVVSDDWMVVTRDDPESGFTFGVARPVAESLTAIRTTAARNFAYGLGLIGLAMLGILPVSGRMSRGVADVTHGAERLARGEPGVEVPVRSEDEIGRLARAFNSMAAELANNQQRLLDEERRRKEQEVEQRLLAAENQRKSQELEEARRFQLSLLPDRLPSLPRLEVAVDMVTATEVGGDYYDFHQSADGALTVAVGDATGHGARAGTMVTVLKSLFTARADELSPGEFLTTAGATVRRMELGRMAMALCLARLEPSGLLTLASAGMPPLLVHRAAGGGTEELATAGVPLGSMAEVSYPERQVQLAAGDTLLLMSDGLPELVDPGGEQLGYARTRQLFAEAAGGTPAELIESLRRAAARWNEGAPPADDVTFVALRWGGATGEGSVDARVSLRPVGAPGAPRG